MTVLLKKKRISHPSSQIGAIFNPYFSIQAPTSLHWPLTSVSKVAVFEQVRLRIKFVVFVDLAK